ncbi:F-box protein At5g07610-like [Rhododendron vialii]|uniref:F-box protein At5g07610-like n=1 Tax=Rhododendron vialii TaxID=182163 RepID=UPI00265ED783|nr:F-box protein At5g07610-like [Rhododendron vialii]
MRNAKRFIPHEGKLESVSLNGSPTTPSLSFLHPLTGDFTVQHSCNGLLLIKYYKQIVDNRFKAQYLVCNPTTQKFHLLDYNVNEQYRDGFSCLLCWLAFDPSKSPHYKVVMLTSLYYCAPPNWEVDIYSSETAWWKKIFLPNEETSGIYSKGAFWNGAIYRLCHHRYNLWRFDIETEEIIGIPCKQGSSRISSQLNTRYFGECGRGGRLLLIQSPSHSALRFKIRKMDKDGCRWNVKCWNVKFRVDLETLISEFPEMESKKRMKFTIMCAVEGENENEFSLILAIPGKMISYNLQKKTWKVLRDNSENVPPRDANIFPFVESLSPV